MAIAYQEVETLLRAQVREAVLDHEAFSMPLKLCVLGECRATCCHDGVWLGEQERETIRDVLTDRKIEGWSETDWFEQRNGRWKSATRSAGNDELSEGFPAHFPRTRCVFLDGEHRCVLQRAAMDEGHHPWFWKPVSCWMHPLILKPGRRGERPLLTLARPANDPAKQDGYPGFSAFTPCGVECAGGASAFEILGEELDLLGMIAGRDVRGELAG